MARAWLYISWRGAGFVGRLRLFIFVCCLHGGLLEMMQKIYGWLLPIHIGRLHPVTSQEMMYWLRRAYRRHSVLTSFRSLYARWSEPMEKSLHE